MFNIEEVPSELRVPEQVKVAEDEKYLKGKENTLIRFYFYLMRGLDVLNSFRNLFLGIIALYIAMKLENVLYGIGMFFVSSIILTLVGRYSVHKLAKLNEWLTMRFSTHYGIKAFNYQEDQVKVLIEIRDLLKGINKQ